MKKKKALVISVFKEGHLPAGCRRSALSGGIHGFAFSF
jgi:hypothetical protein